MKKSISKWIGVMVLGLVLASSMPLWAAEPSGLHIETQVISANEVAVTLKLDKLPDAATAVEVIITGKNMVALTQEKWASGADQTIKVKDIGNNTLEVHLYLVAPPQGTLNAPNGSLTLGTFHFQTNGTATISEEAVVKLVNQQFEGVVPPDMVTTVEPVKDGNTGGGSGGGSGSSSSSTKKPVSPTADVTFTDIKGHWGEESIKSMAKRGHIMGYVDQTFRPDANITRAEFASILNRVFPFSATGPLQSPFEDVLMGQWYTEPVLLLYQNGITSGRSATSFATNEQITNEELATLIGRALRAKGIQLSDERDYQHFADDAKISDFARADVQMLYQAGIINGGLGDQYSPQANASRAQVAAIFDRILLKIEAQEAKK